MNFAPRTATSTLTRRMPSTIAHSALQVTCRHKDPSVRRVAREGGHVTLVTLTSSQRSASMASDKSRTFGLTSMEMESSIVTLTTHSQQSMLSLILRQSLASSAPKVCLRMSMEIASIAPWVSSSQMISMTVQKLLPANSVATAHSLNKYTIRRNLR